MKPSAHGRECVTNTTSTLKIAGCQCATYHVFSRAQFFAFLLLSRRDAVRGCAQHVPGARARVYYERRVYPPDING